MLSFRGKAFIDAAVEAVIKRSGSTVSEAPSAAWPFRSRAITAYRTIDAVPSATGYAVAEWNVLSYYEFYSINTHIGLLYQTFFFLATAFLALGSLLA